jgi:hypothetical protein
LAKPTLPTLVTHAVGADAVLQSRARGQRLEVLLEQFGAGRIMIGLRLVPAGLGQQPFGRLVDIVFPGREDLDVTPLAHRMADGRAGFQHHRLHAALEHVRGGSEAHGASTQNCDGLGLGD